MHEFLVKEWNAEECDGYEADDALGMNQSSDTIICSIDKDLYQIPGNHFNFVKKDFLDFTEHEGRYNFWLQLLSGDKSDDIPGYDGIVRSTVPKFIYKMLSEMSDPEQDIYDLYEDKSQYLINYNLLHIWRRPNHLCLPSPVEKELIGRNQSVPEGELQLEFLCSLKNSLSQW